MGKPVKNEENPFNSKVKDTISKLAGGLCSFRGCLSPVYGGDGKLESGSNVRKSSSLGEAAHIYSSKENGPRGHGGMPPEFISSSANGIWVCRNCHGLIDNSESLYSDKTLFEMKKVREIAQRITLQNTAVRFYVSRLSPEHLDDVVWNFHNRDDEKSIANTFIIYAEAAVSALRELKNKSEYSLQKPVYVERSPIAVAVNKAHIKNPLMVDYLNTSSVTRQDSSINKLSHAHLAKRTQELANGWCYGLESAKMTVLVRCELYTRDLDSGLSSNPEEFDVNCLVIKEALPNGEYNFYLKVLSFENSSIGLIWEMESILNKDGHKITSRLNLRRTACPDNTNDDYEFKIFSKYANILDLVASGKKLYARLSTLSNYSRYYSKTHVDEMKMHPLEFYVETDDVSVRLNEVIEFNEKALLGYRIAHELQETIVYRRFTNNDIPPHDSENPSMLGFFDPMLTESKIKNSISEVKNIAFNGAYKASYVVSKPLVYTKKGADFYNVQAYHYFFYTTFQLIKVLK